MTNTVKFLDQGWVEKKKIPEDQFNPLTFSVLPIVKIGRKRPDGHFEA